MAFCECGEPSTYTCVGCKADVCDYFKCGMDTVDGYLCGRYSMWGCAMKYTTCDECGDNRGIHEKDLVECTECCKTICKPCGQDEFTECDTCKGNFCIDCAKSHKFEEAEAHA